MKAQRRDALRRRIALGLLGVAWWGCSSNEPSSAGASSDASASDASSQAPGELVPAAGDWPAYGRDYLNSRSNPDERIINKENVAMLAPRWSFAESAVTSTPCVFQGAVYFGDWNSVVHAVDAQSGTPLWATPLQEPVPPNQINHTPYVTQNAVYIGAHTALLSALDRATGRVLWQRRVDEQASLMLWSSPVLIDDLLVIGVGSYQVFVPSTPPFRGSVVGVDAATGEVKWRLFLTEGSGVSVWSSAAVDKTRKLAFIGTGQEYSEGANTPHSDALVAFRYETGELAWSRQFTPGDRFQLGTEAAGPDHDVGASPNLFEVGGRALVGVGDKAGRYFAVDRDTGEVVWSRELTTGGPNGGIMASTAYADGVIYVASNHGNSGGLAGLGGGPMESTVFALNASDGTVRWQVPAASGTFGALTLANGILFVPTLVGETRAYDTADGRLLWAGKTGQSMGGGISVSNGMVFAGHGWAWVQNAMTPGGVVAFGLPSTP